MSTSKHAPNTPLRGAVSLRTRILVAAALLALTLAGGLAARLAPALGGSGGSDLVSPGQLQFSAVSGPLSFGGRLDRGSVMAGGDGLVKMELVIRGEHASKRDLLRTPTDLVVVLDRSGSMNGEPIAHALASVRELIAQLSPADRFSLIGYASGAGVVIPFGAATPEARSRWLATLSEVAVGGGTNMASGLDLAATAIAGLDRSGRAPRMILLSDGHANEGDHSFRGLVARATRAVAGEYVLSAIGVGQGFDEALMSALADAGTGNFHYVQRSDELGEIFAAEFATARETLASGLLVEIEAAPGVEILDAAGYPLERSGGTVGFRPGNLFAGQERRVWVSLRMPALPGSEPSDALPIGEFRLAYTQSGERRTLAFAQTPSVARVRGEEEFLAAVDKDAWAMSVVEEELGELKQTVARALRSGERSAAIGRLRAFASKQEAMNQHLASPAVEGAIAEARAMEASVDGAFAAKDESVKNSLGKRYLADGYDQRRQGAKR